MKFSVLNPHQSSSSCVLSRSREPVPRNNHNPPGLEPSQLSLTPGRWGRGGSEDLVKVCGERHRGFLTKEMNSLGAILCGLAMKAT